MEKKPTKGLKFVTLSPEKKEELRAKDVARQLRKLDKPLFTLREQYPDSFEKE